MKPPFDMMRACFWLLAVMMIMEIIATIAGGTMCWINNYVSLKQPGACLEVGVQIRELWTELLTAVLALLLAARSGPPPPPPPPPSKGKQQ